MDDPIIGEIRLLSIDTSNDSTPEGWVLCNGQLLLMQSPNMALYQLIGNKFGGNGRTNFAVPDLRGRVPIGVGQGPGLSPYTFAQPVGSETVALTYGSLPAHTHPLNCNGTAPNTNTPKGNFPSVGEVMVSTAIDMVYAATADSTMNPNILEETGAGLPINIIQPFLVVNYIICVQGVYPPTP